MPRRSGWMPVTLLPVTLSSVIIASMVPTAAGTPPPAVIADFGQPDHGWRGNSMVTALEPTTGGVALRLDGDDPYLIGPAVTVGLAPAERVRIRLVAEAPAGGEFRLFHAAAGQPFLEEIAVQLVPDPEVPGEFSAVIPTPGEPRRYRLDPPAGADRVVLRRLLAEPLVPLRAPARPAPAPVELPADVVRITSGAVTVNIDPHRWNAFVVEVDGVRMAAADPDDRIAVARGDTAVAIGPAPGAVQMRRAEASIVVTTTIDEPATADGAAVWSLERAISTVDGGVRIVTRIAVDRPRAVVHLPWLSLVAGQGTFGAGKHQALVPGVEYLDDEPSSNEKEIRGSAANRRIVAPWKVCLPMMALAAADRWVAIDWEPGAVPVSPLFDSPERVWNSGGHLLGLWSPAVGPGRLEGALEVQRPLTIDAGKPAELVVRIRGGRGSDVAAALADRIGRDGLPPLPRSGAAADVRAASRLLAHGWLDSAARDGLRWRHAVWGDQFPPQPAEDAPAFMLQLAELVGETALADRLRVTAGDCIATLPPDTKGLAGVGHAGRPVGPLLFGDLARTVREAGPAARRAADRLAEQGGVARYHPGAVDLAATLGADHANGFTAIAVEALLEQASLTGDEEAISAALGALAALDAAYPGGVPRGAQPWEMPLHTPDILAAARLVRCFVLGALLGDDDHHLHRAREWAWRGATMVYFAAPPAGTAGTAGGPGLAGNTGLPPRLPTACYATIGVIGATHWTAPNWIGQPVQWCGLVYAAALHDLARIDPDLGPTWRTIASGITRAGLQMTFPETDPRGRGGLLPDYWLLLPQRGEGPAINPGTLQASLAEAFATTPLESMTRLAAGPARGGIVHLAGAVRGQSSTATTTTLDLDTWPTDGSRLLLTRCSPPRRVTWNDVPLEPTLFAAERSLAVPIVGDGRLVIEW